MVNKESSEMWYIHVNLPGVLQAILNLRRRGNVYECLWFEEQETTFIYLTYSNK